MQKILSLILIPLFLFCSCHRREYIEQKEQQKDITILVYHPYVEDMVGVLQSDYNDIVKSVQSNGGIPNLQLLHFSAPNSQKAFLIETSFDEKTATMVNDTLLTYSFAETNYTLPDGLGKVIADVNKAKKADKIGMVIGSHANGWIPVMKAKGSRSFGSGSDITYKTNFTTLAEAITKNGLCLEFLVIDDCNSQNIENAYDLRKATKYIIASATEIMMEGLPYLSSFPLLVNGEYDKFCSDFYEFYENYVYPFATLSMVDCSKFERLAEIMKHINSLYTFDLNKSSEIQPFGGNSYDYPQFYDFADYVRHFCPDENLLKEFESRLADLCPHYYCTKNFYWHSKPFNQSHPINTFCGITCSDPCGSLQWQLKETAWYKDTHD